MRIKHTLAPALLIALFAVMLVQLPLSIAARAAEMEWFDPIIDVRRMILDYYVQQPNVDEMQQAMIDGLLESLDDPYTVYIPYEEIDTFNKDLRGEYVGIGAEVNIVDDYLSIVTPMDGSPALAAGVMAGDLVLEIEGESTYRKSVTDCVDLLQGKPGTDVMILVRRLDGTEREITITRGHIVTHTIKGLRRRGEDWDFCVDEDLGISYVRVTQFNANTVDDLETTLTQLQQEGMNGLVLDLRDNPGGALPAAVGMSNLFLSAGAIVTVKPREGEDRTFYADEEGTLPEFPMIVIVNERSASASEIVAGALQDNHRAKVLGTRSFGKGSVQEVHQLPYERGTLKFTTAHYYLPSGRNINRNSDSAVWGVDPDPGYVIPITDEDYIEQFMAHREFDIIRNGNGETIEEELPCADLQWIDENLKDKQLSDAVEALHTRMQGDRWPEFSDEDPALVALGQELNRALDRRLNLLETLDHLNQRILELNDLTLDAGREPFLPTDIDLTDGTIKIYDQHGNYVGAFLIEGGDVEMALNSIVISPIDEEVNE